MGILSVGESTVTVELLGLARHRAGCTELTATGGTIADLLHSVVKSCPGLHDLIAADGSVTRHYLLCADGEWFVNDLSGRLPPGARLLILGADPGG
jgi:hypothetical protein